MTKRDSAETELVERMRAGDHSAVADLSAGYRSKVFQLAFRYTRNREDAEEIAQDVLLKVFKNIEAFRGDAALSSWIYRITFNAAMSRLRRDRVTREAEVADNQSGLERSPGFHTTARQGDLADWSSLADDEVLRAQLRRRLVRALGGLPPIYRRPIVLRDIHGLSTEEASSALRVTDQTLKSRLHRGRLILRGELADFADGLSLHRPMAQLRTRALEALTGDSPARH